jgi:hypothetical protein
VEGMAMARTGMFHPQGTARMREIHFHRLDGDATDAPGFVAAVTFVCYEGKKGVAAVRWTSRRLRVGWLPLTCSK